MSKHLTEKAIGLVILLLACLHIFGSWVLIQSGKASFGDAVVPIVSAALVIFLTFVFLVVGQESAENNNSEQEKPWSAVLCFGQIIIYVILLAFIGFITATVLFIFTQILTLKTRVSKKDVIVAAIVSVLVTFTLNYVFDNVLHVILP